MFSQPQFLTHLLQTIRRQEATGSGENPCRRKTQGNTDLARERRPSKGTREQQGNTHQERRQEVKGKSNFFSNLPSPSFPHLLLVPYYFLLTQSPVSAQIIPDNTLGSESSIVTPGQLRDLIEGGAIRGGNLFHSFTEFNVNNGQQVYFVNPDSILNIFTRVTGVNPSDIFGTLGGRWGGKFNFN